MPRSGPGTIPPTTRANGGRQEGYSSGRSAAATGELTAWCCRPGIPHDPPGAPSGGGPGPPHDCESHRRHRAPGPRRRRRARYLGITGTNGKSTTTALIGHIPRARPGAGAGRRQHGHEPVLSWTSLDARRLLRPGDVLLSAGPPSITFERWPRSLLNISPDHLDRHGGMAGYIAAKRRIFERTQSPRHRRHRHSTTPSAAAIFERAEGARRHRVIPILRRTAGCRAAST